MQSSPFTLNKLWRQFFQFNWKFGLFVILLFGIPRFILVLQANISGGYSTAFIIFFIMWFAPLIFLTRKGRKEIGIRRPTSFLSLPVCFLTGVLFCTALFFLFRWLFSDPGEQPFTYIAGAGMSAEAFSDSQRLTYFLIAAIPSMLFSPIGEELLYRGVIHGSFVGQFGETRASVFDSLAFAITHLAHFGIVYQAGKWQLLLLPAIIWVVSMFALSQVLFRCKVFSGSIYGAIFSHAGFNFAMMYFIFYC